jgi:hypothetical protein
MKPLETHVDLSCHQALLSRVKELMNREGMLPLHAGREELKMALLAWLDFVEDSRFGHLKGRGANCEDIDTPWH